MDKQNEILQELLSVDLDSIAKSGQQKDRRRKRRLVLLSVVVCFLVVALFAYPHLMVDKDSNAEELANEELEDIQPIISDTTEERQESGENAEQEDVISSENLQQAEQVADKEEMSEVTKQEAPSKEVVEQLQPKDENEQQEQKKPEAPCSHSFAAWDVTKEPTCKQAGEKVRACSLCGSKQTEEIPVGDHNYIDGVCTCCGSKDSSQLVATSISLNYNACFVELGKTLTLTVNVVPADANTKITWTSSDSERISVENGVVKVNSISNERAVITATTDNGLSATCEVHAKQKSPVVATNNGLVYEQFPEILSIDNLFAEPECIAFWTKHQSGNTHFFVYSALTHDQAEHYALEYLDYLIRNGYAYVGRYGDTNRFILNDPSGKYEVQIREEGGSRPYTVDVWIGEI